MKNKAFRCELAVLSLPERLRITNNMLLKRSHANPSRRGSALALALIVVTSVAMLGAGYLQLTSSLAKRQASVVDRTLAFYLAEAGLAESFQAVRMGRSGQVGSETAPASYGRGLVWVDALDTVDGQVRLEATGLCGSGRASLALVVEAVETPLGFFADEELVIESVVLVDGFNSDEATYEETLAAPDVCAYAYWLHGMVGPGPFREVVEYRHDLDNPAGRLGDLTPDQLDGLKAMQPSLAAAYPEGWHEDGPNDSDEGTGGGMTGLGPHTDSGGLLGSNSDVSFQTSGEESVEIYGDIVLGANGSVHGLDTVTVSGSTERRSTSIVLPEVALPSVGFAQSVRYDDLLPMLIPPGTSGFERIEMTEGTELVLRGPATIVIGELILEPGAELSLDTRGGDVELFITGGMDLQQGSFVSTSSDSPDGVTVQVVQIPSSDGAPVNLDATSQFHGTIYAPETEVDIGSDFEVYGGVVARKLNIGHGARLHFDNADFDGSPIPKLIGWRVIEVPAVAKGGRDPFTRLGVDISEVALLTEAHDLSAVEMDLEYVGLGGATLSYSGNEGSFDWALVRRVVSVERTPTRVKEEAATQDSDGENSNDGADPVEDPTEAFGSIRVDVQSALDGMTGPQLRNYLLDMSPLSGAELVATLDLEVLGSGHMETILDAGGSLSERVLARLLTGSTELTSRSTKDVLINNSPLPATVLDLIVSGQASVLSGTDTTAVMAAQ